jgi:D-alanyl-D-alanine carboxypeptidase/D-alanyl-D-alanine-endopeptidase (penicillin-binding protein 4)
VVVDPATETTLFDRGGADLRIPASAQKILTAVAALDALGPSTRLATIAYRDGQRVYIRGGGDPTLRRGKSTDPESGGAASLRELARQISVTLGTDTTVRLVFDDSLFTGPRLGPGWKRGFPQAGVVAPVSALVVDGGRVRPGSRSRVSDPGREAAKVLAGYLRGFGITVKSVRRGITPGDAEELARVESAPISAIVQDMLTDSDNDYAESLGHLVGESVLGEGSFTGGARATEKIVGEAGIDVTEVQLADASGLSPRNRVSASALTDVLTVIARGEEPTWAPVAAGLPVAGVTGTLADRFATKVTKAGRGSVFAKTGTLTGVASLAGWVIDRDQRLLVFAIVGNDVRSGTRARDTMDRIAVRLVECGCR